MHTAHCWDMWIWAPEFRDILIQTEFTQPLTKRYLKYPFRLCFSPLWVYVCVDGCASGVTVLQFFFWLVGWLLHNPSRFSYLPHNTVKELGFALVSIRLLIQYWRWKISDFFVAWNSMFLELSVIVVSNICQTRNRHHPIFEELTLILIGLICLVNMQM